MAGRVELCFLGTGDAFGSGGRFHTCFHLQGPEGNLLIDCGASALIAMKRHGVDASQVGCILLTHLHGDHFGGLPFLLLDEHLRRRWQPLVIAGPPGVEERVARATEVFFPGSTGVPRRFSIEFVELEEGVTSAVGPAQVTPFAVRHASGAPCYALRVAYGGKIVAYSGDTEWSESLVDAARGADLFVCEATFFDKKVKYHLDYRTLFEQRGRLACRRLMLTHMGQEVLDRLDELQIECAHDGQTILL